MPNDWKCQTPDHKVNEQICHSVPAIERVLIDAFASRNGLVPVESYWFTLKDRDKHTDREEEDNDYPRHSEEPTKPSDDRKDSIVEEDE